MLLLLVYLSKWRLLSLDNVEFYVINILLLESLFLLANSLALGFLLCYIFLESIFYQYESYCELIGLNNLSICSLPFVRFYSNKKNKINIDLKPVVVYLNSLACKKVILKDNNGKAGIYRWTHIESGKSYVGSSLNLSRRLRNYFSISYLEKSNGGNSIIYNALLKYGYSAFMLEILEYCDPKDITNREQYYIDLLRPEYNILRVARSSIPCGDFRNEILKGISAGNRV